MRRWSRFFGLFSGVTLALLLVTSPVVSGQSAQIQAAIRALLAGNNIWTGTNTFQAITVSSCTGCGGGGTPGGSSGQIQYNNAGAFGGFGSWNGSVFSVASVALGTGPFASVGEARLQFNGFGIQARNSDNSGDVRVAYPSGSLWQFGDGQNSLTLETEGSDGWTILASGNSYAWPTSDGSAGEVLSTNADGTMSWIPQSGSNPFDQNLNTTDPVAFLSVSAPLFTSSADTVVKSAAGVYIVGDGNVVTAGGTDGNYAIGIDNELGQGTPSEQLFAFGLGNTLDADLSFAFGRANTLTARGLAFGRSNTVSATDAITVGLSNEAAFTGSMAFGRNLFPQANNEVRYGSGSGSGRVVLQGVGDVIQLYNAGGGTTVFSAMASEVGDGNGVGLTATDGFDDGMMTPANGGSVAFVTGAGVNGGTDGNLTINGTPGVTGTGTCTITAITKGIITGASCV